MVVSKPKPSGKKNKSDKLKKKEESDKLKEKQKSDKLRKKEESDKLYKTVCCYLCADELTRKFLWEVMEKHGLLINALLDQVGHSLEFEEWKQQGWLPDKALVEWCKALKQENQFKGFPSRFYISAQSIVKEMVESWVKLQKQLLGKSNGKKRWLKSVQEDIELSKITDLSPEMIQNRAKEILLELYQQENSESQSLESLEDNSQEDQQEDEGSDSQPSLFTLLFDTYDMYKVTEDFLSRRAIVHLLKNEGEVNEEIEKPEKLEERLVTKREEIQRLEEQLASRLPKGRDPTGEQALIFLEEAIQLPEHPNCYPPLFLFNVFYHYALLPTPYVQYTVYLLQKRLIEQKIVESEFLAWQESVDGRLANAAKITNSSLYPLSFGSTDDLYWLFETKEGNQQDPELRQSCEGTKLRKRPSKRKRKKLKTRSEERISVRFKGFGEFVFRVNCDRRQLPLFRLFATDYDTHKKLDKEHKYSLGLFAFRSAKLIWKEDKQLLHKKKTTKQANLEDINTSLEPTSLPPWKTHRLYLHCSFDPDLLTAEGTEKVRLRKIAETRKKLDNTKKKEQELLAQASADNLTEQERQELKYEAAKRRKGISAYETSLIQLNNIPPRPSKVPYQGEANITLGISLCRQELIGVAVVDLQTQQVLEYYSIRKLLTNRRVKKLRRNRSLLQLKLEKYRLVNRLRKLKRRNLVYRQKEQKQGQVVESNTESNLSQYLERLIAARIAQVALKWQASSVVIPDLEGMSEYIESAVQARAKQLFPNHREKQKNYAKQFRIEGHRWSYTMLTEFIRSRVLSEGISVKVGRQPVTGSLVDKSRKIALSAHSLA
ncbi:hypothetical protein H6G00_17820 [Leptolyngbya sp. FACHB-541]|uniref:type V CRISPR-associated protein Cas12k n=1 Tax=Leptolyngbya sp. FACHB-541 TaxID=2692810 RepID=UPI0016889DC1|nr:type V CRISPR-associated protein Cas12k [Leptolyngbya sp. FACHB-541]MBD1998465.1 hypothetical protein [Leptolyngbya sp. FACHB-541]